MVILGLGKGINKMEILDKALDKALDEVIETVTNNTEIISHLRKEYPGPNNAKLDIRHLWNNNYRINYWVIKEGENKIVDSKFVVVTRVKNGFLTTVL